MLYLEIFELINIYTITIIEKKAMTIKDGRNYVWECLKE